MEQPESAGTACCGSLGELVSEIDPIKEGDPCTIIEPHAGGRTQAVYARETRGEYVQFSTSPIHVRYSRKIDAEGIEWIRGHHAIDSAEVLALLAAGALATEQPLQTFASMTGSWLPASLAQTGQTGMAQLGSCQLWGTTLYSSNVTVAGTVLQLYGSFSTKV